MKLNIIDIGVFSYYVDVNGNKWNVEAYTEEEAISLSKTLINCSDCVNSSNCLNCVECYNCTYCINCNHIANKNHERDLLEIA